MMEMVAVTTVRRLCLDPTDAGSLESGSLQQQEQLALGWRHCFQEDLLDVARARMSLAQKVERRIILKKTRRSMRDRKAASGTV